ncbi:MAG: hypothetical protein JEZ04_00770 [Spirochaetales bacterium]|nr:hypothetical protein [Spirochaetales bacterium]
MIRSGGIINNCFIIQDEIGRDQYFIYYQAKALYSASEFVISFVRADLKDIPINIQTEVLELMKSIYKIESSNIVAPFEMGCYENLLYLSYRSFEFEYLDVYLAQSPSLTTEFCASVISRILHGLLVLDRFSAWHGLLTSHRVCLPLKGLKEGLACVSGVFDQTFSGYCEADPTEDLRLKEWFAPLNSDDFRNQSKYESRKRDLFSISKIMELLLSFVNSKEKNSRQYQSLVEFSEKITPSKVSILNLLEIELQFEQIVREKNVINLWNDEEITKRYKDMLGSDIHSDSVEWNSKENKYLDKDDSMPVRREGSETKSKTFIESDKLPAAPNLYDESGKRLDREYSERGGQFFTFGKSNMNKENAEAVESAAEGNNKNYSNEDDGKKIRKSDKDKSELSGNAESTSGFKHRLKLRIGKQGQIREDGRVSKVIEKLNNHNIDHLQKDDQPEIQLKTRKSENVSEDISRTYTKREEPPIEFDFGDRESTEISDIIDGSPREYSTETSRLGEHSAGSQGDFWDPEERKNDGDAIDYDFNTITGTGPAIMDGSKIDVDDKTSAVERRGRKNQRNDDMVFPTEVDGTAETSVLKNEPIIPERKIEDYPIQQEHHESLKIMPSSKVRRDSEERSQLSSQVSFKEGGNEVEGEILELKAVKDEDDLQNKGPVPKRSSPLEALSGLESEKRGGRWKRFFDGIKRIAEKVVSGFRK